MKFWVFASVFKNGCDCLDVSRLLVCLSNEGWGAKRRGREDQ